MRSRQVHQRGVRNLPVANDPFYELVKRRSSERRCRIDEMVMWMSHKLFKQLYSRLTINRSVHDLWIQRKSEKCGLG
jgi:hypothetical protein